jgi:hypothetical protein
MTLRAIKSWLKLGSALAALSSTIVIAQEHQSPLEQAAPPEEGKPEPGQERLPPCPLPPPTAQPAPRHKHHNLVFAPSEVSILAGAGAGNYFGGGMPATTDTGAAWDARVTFGTHSIIALEAGYVGAVNNLEMGNSQGTLTSNGLDGDFRLQLPYRVQPYIFSGVGWNNMQIETNTGALSAVTRGSDNEVTVPAGGGLAAYLGKNEHVTLDLRGTYRYQPDNNIMVTNTGALHQWVAQARVGYAF